MRCGPASRTLAERLKNTYLAHPPDGETDMGRVEWVFFDACRQNRLTHLYFHPTADRRPPPLRVACPCPTTEIADASVPVVVSLAGIWGFDGAAESKSRFSDLGARCHAYRVSPERNDLSS